MNSGALIQKGKSFYLGNKELLPEYVSKNMKYIEQKMALKLYFVSNSYEIRVHYIYQVSMCHFAAGTA